jgi:hypothetical protein
MDTGLPGETRINAARIGELSVAGNIVGFDSANRVKIEGRGYYHSAWGEGAKPHFPQPLGSIRVSGDVTHADIVARVGQQFPGSIGTVRVDGDWTASNLLAGLDIGPDGVFNTDDDMRYDGSRIAQVLIGGQIAGTPAGEDGSDLYAIAAGRIAAFQVGQTKLKLSFARNDSQPLGATGDVELREWQGSAL